MIDPRGEIASALPLFSASVLIVEVAILQGETLYARFGDWFAWLTTVISLTILFQRWRAPVAG